MDDYIEEQLAKCRAKEQYASELDARTFGREHSSKRNVELYVYKCPYCTTWHLTSKARAEYWNVNAEFVELDDYEDILGDKLFWHRLQDMPLVEALDIVKKTLRKVKQTLSAVGPKLQNDPDVRRWIQLKNRLEEEQVFMRFLCDNNVWRRAVKMLYGEEGYEKVKQIVIAEREGRG
jgi:hypothetical protein